MKNNEPKIPVTLPAASLPHYDTIVCGGGLAGFAAAVRSAENGAKTLLIDNGGDLGGDITKAFVPQLLDPAGKGGLVRDINNFLNEGGHTSARRGPRYDENGKKIPGTMIDVEYLQYYLAKRCKTAGVEVLYYSLVTGVEMEENGREIASVLIATECGFFRATAHTYIDATGNGLLAAYAGCEYECGHPDTGEPQPASAGVQVIGVQAGAFKADNDRQKVENKERLEAAGIKISSEGFACIEGTVDGVYGTGGNMQYHVYPDDPFAFSRATTDAKIENFEFVDQLRALPEFAKIAVVHSSTHIGIREGRRIFGRYYITVDDIISGARFEDAVCLVRFGVDVHRVNEQDDHFKHSEGRKVHPYNIPFRALIPRDCDNLFLAGRCISGDFYAHSSYRVACDVIPTGEAVGYAAAQCAKDGKRPCDADGLAVSAFMREMGYDM